MSPVLRSDFDVSGMAWEENGAKQRVRVGSLGDVCMLRGGGKRKKRMGAILNKGQLEQYGGSHMVSQKLER